MDKLKVIITGSKGFIGRNLKKNILSSNNFIVFEINEEIFETSDWKKNLETIIVSVKPEFVFHVGACSNTLETDVNYIMLRNVEFTKVLCDLSSKFWFNIIYSSSASIYGSDNNHPSNLYGWTKYISEDYIKKVNGISLRYFNVYGPGEEHKGKMSSIIYQSYLKYKNNQKVRLFPGNPTRDFVYIDDVISSNLHSLNNFELLKGGIYEVGTGIPNSFETILKNFEIPFEYTDLCEIPQGYQFYTCSSKDKWVNGWYPKHDLVEGLNKYKNYLTLKS